MAMIQTLPRRIWSAAGGPGLEGPLERPLFLVFLLLIGGTLMGSRDFSHLNVMIGGLPLYVTEAFLFLWAVVRVVRAREIIRLLPQALSVAALGYLLVGALELIRSLRGPHVLADVLRDAALFYYAVFLYVGADLLRTRWRADRLVQLFVAVSYPIVAIGFFNQAEHHGLEITTSGCVRALTIAQGMYLIMSIIAALTALSLNWRPMPFYAASLPVSVVGLVMTQSRSVMLGFPVVLVVWLVARWPSWLRRLPLLLLGLVGIMGVAYVLSSTSVAKFAGCVVLSQRVQSLGHLTTDPNAEGRFHSWVVALGYAKSHLLAGVGFGHLSLLPAGGAPHNSLITIAFEAGVIGSAAFLAVTALFWIACIRSLLTTTDIHGRALLALALAWQASVLGISLLNVGLEGPFIGMFYWLSMGLGMAVIRTLAPPVPAAVTPVQVA